MRFILFNIIFIIIQEGEISEQLNLTQLVFTVLNKNGHQCWRPLKFVLLLSTMLIDDEAIVNHSKLRMREADDIHSG